MHSHRFIGLVLSVGCVAVCGLGLALAGCTSGDEGDPGDGSGSGSDLPDPGGTLPPPAQGFQIVTPILELQPGAEVTYCYYTRMPNPEMVGVKQWESKMTPGSHHMILYFTQTELKPAGTLTQDGCGAGLAVWTYSAQEPSVKFDMPKDIGMTVPGGQPAFIQMHYLNATDKVMPVRVTLNALTYAPTETFTPASAFITYNSNIDIPGGTPNAPGTASAGGDCTVSPSAKFFTMSTHAHKQAVKTEIRDGGQMLFSATDWEHPGARSFAEAPFYSFTSGKLTYRCEYANPTGRRIYDGDSAVTQEMCMAIGYYFPATRPTMCINSAAFPL
jgi:hypothetical protein